MFDFAFWRQAPAEIFGGGAPGAAGPRPVRSWPARRGGGGLAGDDSEPAQDAAARAAASLWADDERAESLPEHGEVPEVSSRAQRATPAPAPGADSAFGEPQHDEKRGLASVEAVTGHGKVSARLNGQDFVLRFPPGMRDGDRQRLADDALRTMGVTVADREAFIRRLAAGEDVIEVKRELEVATPAEAAEQARRLFDTAVVGVEDFDLSAASRDERTRRTLEENGDNGYEAALTTRER